MARMVGRAWGGAAEHFEDGGAAEELEGEEGGDGVAGEAEVGDGAAVGSGEAAEGEGLAGPHADRPEVDLALAGEDLLDDVVVAAGNAGGGDDEVGAGNGLVDLVGEGVEGVADDAEGDGEAAEFEDGGGQAVGVAVVNLAGLGGLAGAEELVAGGEDGDGGVADDGHAVDAHGGEEADLGGAQEGAAGEDGGALADVLGAAADVGAGPGGACGR